MPKTCLSLLAIILLPLNSLQAVEALFTLQEKIPEQASPALFIVDATEQYQIVLDPEVVAQDPDALEIELPGGRTLTVERTRFKVYNPNWKSWSGALRIAGEVRLAPLSEGYAHLVYHGDHITGVLNIGTEQYQIGTTASSEHRLVRISQARGPNCAIDLLGRELVPNLSASQPPLPDVEDESPLPSSGEALTRIDVMAIWPSAYSSMPVEEAKLPSFIQASISLANDILFRSLTFAEYNLVYAARFTGGSQPPATGLLDGLTWLNSEPPALRSLRNAHAADIVVLIIPAGWSFPNVCGVANLPEKHNTIRGYPIAFNDRAYSVSRQGCGLNDFTLAHEIGHNYGMRHDNESTSDPDHLFPYGRGNILSYLGRAQATVMGCKFTPGDIFGAVCNRIPQFSDPIASPAGLPTPTGNSTRNNGWVGRSQAGPYSNFRP